MITALSKQPAWVEGLTPELRATLMEKLRAGLEIAETAREIASVVRAITSLEKNDIDRTRLFIDAEKQGDGGESDVELFRQTAEDIVRRRPRPPASEDA